MEPLTPARRERWAWLRHVPPYPLAALAISSVIIAIVALTQNFLLAIVQIGFLVLGMAGSYTLGRQAERGPEIPVRGAFRRMARLYVQLFALKNDVGERRTALGHGEPVGDLVQAISALELVEFTLTQNLGTIEDAMDDWADLVPEEIEELRRRRGEGEIETLEGTTTNDR